MMIAPNSSITREELCNLPLSERLAYTERISVNYPRSNEIVEMIQQCRQRSAYAVEPPCLLLVGLSGAGKSTLVKRYVEKHPPQYSDSGTYRPVLYVTTPSKATIGSLSTEILSKLGDPRADKGTIGNKQLRVIEFVRVCRVEIIFVDEIQHFVDANSRKILWDVSNWLKTIIKNESLNLACVLIGLQGDAERVVDTNEQLARLFGDPITLAPFQWKEAEPDTVKEFRTFLSEVEKRLPLKEPSNLHHRERAWRCFVACQGIVSHLMKLIRNATHKALVAGHEHLDDSLLAETFNSHLASARRGVSNPFVGPPPSQAPPIKPPKADEEGTNRRSQSRGGGKQEKLSDFL
jgi:GTPase SAR1 family protein